VTRQKKVKQLGFLIGWEMRASGISSSNQAERMKTALAEGFLYLGVTSDEGNLLPPLE